jgi:EAL domain-containing protein (putative c-di-GMP-specific phosphodiesterase class I)
VVESIAWDDRARTLFLNVHPRNLADPDLLDRTSPLVLNANRVVLEVPERALLGGGEIARRTLARLRECGFRFAIDALGAEYTGLTSFALLEPEFVKFDATLVRDIDASPAKKKLVGSIASLCKDMGVTIIAVGVETYAERDSLIELGCELQQGYLFARPGRALAEPRWEAGFGAVRSDFPVHSEFPLSGTHPIPNESQPPLSGDHGDARAKRLRMG